MDPYEKPIHDLLKQLYGPADVIRFLQEPQRLLNDNRPIDLMQSGQSEQVYTMLMRLADSVFI